MTSETLMAPVSGNVRLGRLLIAGLIGGALAAAANIVLLVIGQASGVGFMAPLGGPDAPLQAIGPVNVIILCMSPAVVAALLLALLRRSFQRPIPIFVAISGIFLLVSLFPDWALPMDSLATRMLLSLMHVIAAALIVGALLRASRS